MSNQRTVISAVLAVGLAATLPASGVAAGRITVHDDGYLQFRTSSGSVLIDEGRVSGTLPGRARVRFTYNGGPTVNASFTISGSGWSLQGMAKCRLSNPNSKTPSFRGSLTLRNGGGRYVHAHGSGELFGVFDRRSYALTVQARGTLYT
jgi:hypothetical protein